MSPLILNTIIYDAALPLTSSDFSATMTSSFVIGTNLNEEKPRVTCNGPMWVMLICEKSSLAWKTMFVALCSSSTSAYVSLLARRGRKNHCPCMSLHTADSWITYPASNHQRYIGKVFKVSKVAALRCKWLAYQVSQIRRASEVSGSYRSSCDAQRHPSRQSIWPTERCSVRWPHAPLSTPCLALQSTVAPPSRSPTHTWMLHSHVMLNYQQHLSFRSNFMSFE